MGADDERREGLGLAKVTVPLAPSDWHEHANETMWAQPLGENRFRIQNVPFYAFGLSYDDVVEAPTIDNQNVMRAVVQRGGHSTYRIIVSNSTSPTRFREFWLPLEHLGCTLERATERFLGIDVPPEADIYKVYDLLQGGEAASVWDFEEAHVGHALKTN